MRGSFNRQPKFQHEVVNGKYFCTVKDRNPNIHPEHYTVSMVSAMTQNCMFCGKGLKHIA